METYIEGKKLGNEIKGLELEKNEYSSKIDGLLEKDEWINIAKERIIWKEKRGLTMLFHLVKGFDKLLKSQ